MPVFNKIAKLDLKQKFKAFKKYSGNLAEEIESCSEGEDNFSQSKYDEESTTEIAAASAVNEEQMDATNDTVVAADAASFHQPNATGLEVTFSEPSKWVERMALTAVRPLPSDLSPDDDPKREEVFIQHAIISAMRGLRILDTVGVPWRRPEDYYAEMFKSDVHMDHIRENILTSKKKIQEHAQRRSMKDQKKFGKEVQAEVLRQRAKHKKDLMERITDWRKKRKGGNRARLEDVIEKDETEQQEKEGRKGIRFAGGDKKTRRDHFLNKKKDFIPGKGRMKGGIKRPGKNRRRK